MVGRRVLSAIRFPFLLLAFVCASSSPTRAQDASPAPEPGPRLDLANFVAHDQAPTAPAKAVARGPGQEVDDLATAFPMITWDAKTRGVLMAVAADTVEWRPLQMMRSLPNPTI